MPSLAESYDVSPDGMTYTFKLHPGVKFSNGREVIAADVKYSIERAINPKTQGPGAGFFGSIVGVDDMTARQGPDPLRHRDVDDHTVEFTLSRPTRPSCM